jgi:carbon storage regulator CsrA
MSRRARIEITYPEIPGPFGVASLRIVAQNVPHALPAGVRTRKQHQAARRSMLVLSRGVDEAVVIGDTIVRVVDVRDNEVRLGIASPHARPRYREVTLRRDNKDEPLKLALPERLSAL